MNWIDIEDMTRRVIGTSKQWLVRRTVPTCVSGKPAYRYDVASADDALDILHSPENARHLAALADSPQHPERFTQGETVRASELDLPAPDQCQWWRDAASDDGDSGYFLSDDHGQTLARVWFDSESDSMWRWVLMSNRGRRRWAESYREAMDAAQYALGLPRFKKSKESTPIEPESNEKILNG